MFEVMKFLTQKGGGTLVSSPDPDSFQQVPVLLTLDTDSLGIVVDEPTSYLPVPLWWKYARICETDGNGEQYADFLARTRDDWGRIFHEVILPQWADNLPFPEGFPDEIQEEWDTEFVAFTLTEGPAGELALNGGAYRVWTIEKIDLGKTGIKSSESRESVDEILELYKLMEVE